MTDGVFAFTGSREGCTPPQEECLRRLFGILFGKGYRTLHNGCAVGADLTAAKLAKGVFRLVGHPCNLARYVSEEAVGLCDEVREVCPPLDRNKAMVDLSAVLVACPNGAEEVRSGTWATIRYARKSRRPILLCDCNEKLHAEGEIS